MHEMGLMDAMLRMIDKIKAEQELEGINKIVLEVGALSGVVPRFLEECFEAVSDGTDYEDTELSIEVVPGTLRCNDCGLEFPADVEHLFCPECMSKKLTPMTGKDLTLKELQAY